MSTDASAVYQAQVISDLNSIFKPHVGQINVLKSIFVDGKKRVFVECGRKWGKSEAMPYIAYRMAMSFPNQVIYVIGPFMKQMKEISWADGRFPNFLPPGIREKYLDGEPNNTEMRIKFKNGSFIKLDGADNYQAFRGPNPHLMMYDEFKDHHPKFHESNEPNLLANDGVLFVVGTPPETDGNLFCKLADEIKEDDEGAYFNYPSWVNPHLKREWFIKQKARLIKRGEWDVWMREYEAKRVKGGCNAIFPMFSKSKHVIKYEDALSEIRRSAKDWDYHYMFDPGSKSVFAGMAMVVNKHTKKVIFVDEIYEKNTSRMSTGIIYPMAQVQIANIHPMQDRWTETYDNAAAWFANEVSNQYERNIMPCEKDVKTKNDKESLVKDMMNNGFFFVTDKCINFISEIENYVKDDKGKTDKCADHLLDCCRYGLNAANYDLNPDMTLPKEDERRFYTPESERKDIDDPVYGMFEWMYE